MWLTDQGMTTLAALDEPLVALHHKRGPSLQGELKELIRLLEKAGSRWSGRMTDGFFGKRS